VRVEATLVTRTISRLSHYDSKIFG
jgi:hypothetical protein